MLEELPQTALLFGELAQLALASLVEMRQREGLFLNQSALPEQRRQDQDHEGSHQPPRKVTCRPFRSSYATFPSIIESSGRLRTSSGFPVQITMSASFPGSREPRR